MSQTLGSWDRIPLDGCLSAFVLCLCCPVYVAALRRANPPSKESYQLSTRSIFSELILNGNTPESQIRQGRRRILIYKKEVIPGSYFGGKRLWSWLRFFALSFEFPSKCPRVISRNRPRMIIIFSPIFAYQGVI
jgi:hypothetical protein